MRLYLLSGTLTLKNGKIDKYLFDGGYAQASAASTTSDNFTFYYYTPDHLGNIREVVDASGNVQQVTNYYPFGATYAESTAADFQPYKYNGKELDKMHGLNTYDYGARQYNPILARWDRIDPMCEKYYNVSSYVYCANSPIILVDPDGKETGMPLPGIYVGFIIAGHHNTKTLAFTLIHPMIARAIGSPNDRGTISNSGLTRKFLCLSVNHR